jgi:hypothetical protein
MPKFVVKDFGALINALVPTEIQNLEFLLFFVKLDLESLFLLHYLGVLIQCFKAFLCGGEI